MIRKKRIIDSTDRGILRVLHSSNNRGISGSFIAKKVNLTPPAIKPRLVNLQLKGIIKPLSTGGLRSFDRIFTKKLVKIQAPSKILWGLDIETKKSRKTKRLF